MNSGTNIQKAISNINDALVNKQLKKAEELAIVLLKERDYDPDLAQVWLSLAESLFHQGYQGAAKKVFQRVMLLDPKGSWIPTVQNMIKGVHMNSERKDIDQLLEVPKTRVAAGILVKNEERCIKRCIDSVLRAVDEIVVIDTGSTDKTLEILSTYSHVKRMKVVHFNWCDDFSAARNFGLKHIESDWVLWVDADEYLHEEDIENPRMVAGLLNQMELVPILKVGQFNLVDGGLVINYDQERMFRLDSGVKYIGKVHEQVRIPEGIGGYYSTVNIRLMHDGYEKHIMQDKKKIERNINLLKQMVKEDPDNPGWWLFLGRETLAIGNIDEAIQLLLEAEKRTLKVTMNRTAEIYVNLIKAYMLKNEMELAEKACKKAIQTIPNFPDFHYLLGSIKAEKAVNLFMEAGDCFIKSKRLFEEYKGDVSPDNRILDFQADIAMADIYRLTGDLVTAQKVFKSILKKYPDKIGVRKQLESIEKQRNELEPFDVNQTI